MEPESAQKFVIALYRGMLRREPDEDGLHTWVEALVKGLDPATLVVHFTDSPEFKSKRPVNLFVPPGHFYSPVADREEISRLYEEGGDVQDVPGIRLNKRKMLSLWSKLAQLMSISNFPQEASTDPLRKMRYWYNNPAFSWGDGAMLNAMIRHFRPKTIIEVGNGWSSACILDTVEHFLSSDCDLTFVDPDQSTLKEIAGSALKKAKCIELAVQDTDITIFDKLKAGDFLIIDSTHVLKSFSDVHHELFRIFPRLAKGVIVHIHDIFWPFEYPKQWVVNENRSWNELYALRAFLTSNLDWEILMFNDYMAKCARNQVEQGWRSFLNNPGGAFWMQKQ